MLKSPFKLVCFVYPIRHFQGNLPFDLSQIMLMDRQTYTKHGPPVHGPPCGPTILDKSPWDSAAVFIFFCNDDEKRQKSKIMET